MNVRK
jgi:Ca2+-binding EF-hand superfamily protein